MKNQLFDCSVFEERVKEVAKKAAGKAVTGKEIAEAVEVSGAVVSKWFNGGSTPTTEQLIKLSKAYGCSIDYLLGNDSNTAGSLSDSQVCELLMQIDAQIGLSITVNTESNPQYAADNLPLAKVLKMSMSYDLINEELPFQSDEELRKKRIIKFFDQYIKLKSVDLPAELIQDCIRGLLDNMD